LTGQGHRSANYAPFRDCCHESLPASEAGASTSYTCRYTLMATSTWVSLFASIWKVPPAHHPPSSLMLLLSLRVAGLNCLPLRASNEGLLILPLSLQGSGRGCPSLRASSDRRFIAAALRARRAPGRSPPSPLFEHLPNPRLDMIQPLAQVGLKRIGLGLHHQALGLELVLEQRQLGE